jgi:cysteinyl-tRNA synthetase
MLQIYNALTKQKQEFKPINPKQVTLYVCGVTVYDYCHIGHARTYLVFDMLHRFLKFRGYKVKYIRNITDIEDKIINRAFENNESCDALAERFTKAMHEDFNKLNLLPPTEEPKATEYVDKMVNLIEDLIKKGYAYAADNGDVYYDVASFKSYGCLAHRDLEDLHAGARVEVNEAKRSPLDFVLWKSAKPHEPKWPSPWGEGRPGWHTECSVMSLDTLGETLDIHGGGLDLKFPHHENERAQSEATTGKTFVNTWMYSGFLQIDKEKMSKSLNNFLTIRDFLKEFHPEVMRYFTLSSHYRSPAEYSMESITNAISALDRMYIALRGLPAISAEENKVNEKKEETSEYEQRFIEAMEDDFNTPLALSILFDLVREINRDRLANTILKRTTSTELEKLAAILKKLGNILGILTEDPEIFLQGRKTDDAEKEQIEKLIEERNAARKAKNWALSDQLRDKLVSHGVVLEDSADGTLWRRELK